MSETNSTENTSTISNHSLIEEALNLVQDAVTKFESAESNPHVTMALHALNFAILIAKTGFAL